MTIQRELPDSVCDSGDDLSVSVLPGANVETQRIETPRACGQVYPWLLQTSYTARCYFASIVYHFLREIRWKCDADILQRFRVRILFSFFRKACQVRKSEEPTKFVPAFTRDPH